MKPQEPAFRDKSLVTTIVRIAVYQGLGEEIGEEGDGIDTETCEDDLPMCTHEARRVFPLPTASVSDAVGRKAYAVQPSEDGRC